MNKHTHGASVLCTRGSATRIYIAARTARRFSVRWGARSYLVVVRKGAFIPQDEQENPFSAPFSEKIPVFSGCPLSECPCSLHGSRRAYGWKTRDEKADRKTSRKVRKLIPVAFVSSA